MEDNLNDAAELFYFKGDFRPNILEESITEFEPEEEEKRQAEASSAANPAICASEQNNDDMDMDDLCLPFKAFYLDDRSSSNDQKQTNPQESRRLSVQRCIHYLVHAVQCQDANCSLPGCQKMKRVVQHAKICKRKTNGGCPICKQLVALCCYHAKHCQETTCPVPFCLNIRHKIRQQQLELRFKQAKILKRRIASMARGMPTSQMTPPPAICDSEQNNDDMDMNDESKCPVPLSLNTRNKLRQKHLQQRLRQAQILKEKIANVITQMTPAAPTAPTSNQTLPLYAPGIDMKFMPLDWEPPIGALQAVQQVQAAAARQQVPSMVNYEKGNPLMGHAGSPIMINPQMQSMLPMTQDIHSAEMANRMIQQQQQVCEPNRWESPNVSLQPIPSNQQPFQQMIIRAQAPINPANQNMGPPRPSPTMDMQKLNFPAVRQLLHTLRLPSSPSQQRQVLHILKTNPQLMAEFLKYKRAQIGGAPPSAPGVSMSPPQQQQ